MSKLQLPRPAGKQPAAAQPQPERPQVPLLETDPAKGLTAEQAAQRMAAGLDNHAAASPTRSEIEIIRDNIFTFFNLVFIVLALCLALVGSFANMTFLGVVIANTIIGTVQQLRSKRTVDQLTLVAAHKVRCLRDGKSILLPSEELVRDDIVEFTSGEQICADAVVCTGSAQANEALITGEAEPVPKNVGDVLRSGSFLVSGRCTVRLTHVGAESYASKLATEAREGGHKVAKGEMMRSLDGLIRVIGIALIPMGVVMFLKQYVSLELPLRDSVEATVAALIGMIPEGLYLLTSVALAVSMVRLAQRKVLAQDMNCIETLARVDVLCVDKTGTITEARMEAGEPLLLTPDAWPQDRVYTVLHSIYAGTEPDNDTARAMVQRFGKQNGTPWPRQSVVPFNSAYKWSAATFAEGSFVVGAPEFVAGARYAELAAQVEPLLEKGSRVLLLARCDAEPDPKVGLDADKLEFVALLPVANRIRPEAPETFRYFEDQGVHVKVISGDTPVTVSEVARQAGIAHAEDYIDASKYADDALAAETKEAKKANLQAIKDNLVAMFIQSGVADCESLQNIYGPKVEASKTDSAFLKKALNILKLMKCNESEVYFKASEYMYQIDPTADAAVGVAYMYYKKGDYDNAVKYFDEALAKETDNDKKAEMAYATAAALMQAKKLSQARSYCQKAMSFKENYGEPYILLAQLYGSNPNWTDEPALNKCTYFVVIDKLQRAKAVDPSVTERANELISTYSRHTPQAKDLFMLGYKAGDRITIGGWIGESTTIR